MKNVSYISCVIVLCVGLIDAQSAPSLAGASPVSLGDKKTITGLNGFFANFQDCDTAGDIYLFARKIGSQFPANPAPAFDRITPDAAIAVSFSAGRGRFVGVGYGQDGEIAIIMNRDRLAGFTTGDYLLRYDSAGNRIGEFRFEKDLNLAFARLALFPNRNVLVVPIVPARKRGERPNSVTDMDKLRWLPPLAIYDTHAGFVTKVERLRGDETVHFINTASGPDGNIYVVGVNAGPGKTNVPAIIYAIAPSGEILRRLEIAPPSTNMGVSHLQVTNGKIILLFLEHSMGPAMVSVNGWDTGERLKLYQLPDKVKSLACYDPVTEQMTFVDQTFPFYPANRVSLRIARPDLKP